MNLDELYQEETLGANDEGVAEPQTEEVNADTEQAEDNTSETTSEVADPVQSEEENRTFANIRRKAEADAKAKYEAEKEGIYRSLGLVNPVTNKIVTNQAEYEQYLEVTNKAKSERLKQEMGLTEEEYQAFLDSIPEVQKARAAEQSLEAEKARIKEEEAKAAIDKQVTEISKLDSNIKTLEDLTKMENYEEFYGLVQQGYSLDHAYKLTNFDRLTNKTAEVAKQQALNAVNSKAHLSVTEQKGVRSVHVPADVVRQIRQFMPNATDEEIQKAYAKYGE